MTTAIQILRLDAYHGPNIFSPQPGVLLQVSCDQDYSKRLKHALKDSAQAVGLVMAYLDVAVETPDTPDGAQDQVRISASFTTHMPALGAALAEYVVDGIRARVTGDDEWDADTPLVALQDRRRQEALPLPALQILAEAHKRSVPVLTLPNGQIQLGYGVAGWQFDPAAYKRTVDADEEETPQQAQHPEPPWEQIGAIPIYAVTGEHSRSAFVQATADRLRAVGYHVTALDNAGYADSVAALAAQNQAACVVVGLRTAAILQHGLAFTRCTQSIITDSAGALPEVPQEEWVRALGVPMLISQSPALLPIGDAAIASLLPYAPYGVLALDDGVHGLVV